MSPEQEKIALALCEPFHPEEVEFKPATVSGNRCMALAYVDARCVMDRLDEVMGPGEWQDHYEVLGDCSVKCTLTLRIGGEWVSKEDVGSTSDQPDSGDRLKAAFSDAIKRAAVKFGVGRYLYRLPRFWVDYDPTKKKLTPPILPQWALPYAKKLQEATQASGSPEEQADFPERMVLALEGLQHAASQGLKELEAQWKAMRPDEREHHQRLLPALKKKAQQSDSAKSK